MNRLLRTRRLHFERLEDRQMLASIQPLGLGLNGSASDVSADGAVVVGSIQPASGVIWNAGRQLILDTLSADAVSGDGKSVVGAFRSSSFGPYEAYRWNSSGVTNLGRLRPEYSAGASGVSDDGMRVVGGSGGLYSGMAFLWSQQTGTMQSLVIPPAYTSSGAAGISADGTTIIGILSNFNGVQEAFRWTLNDGVQGLGDLIGGDFTSRASDVSADGSVIVGKGTSAKGSEAFVWTASSGMRSIGELAGGQFGSEAKGVSRNGSVVVGSSLGPSGKEAFRWTSATGMQSLHEALVQAGVNMTGWMLSEATATSANGSVIVGNGWLNSVPTAWRVTLDLIANPTADIALVDATTRDFVSYDISYRVTGEAVPAFTFAAYHSADGITPVGAALGSLAITDLAERSPSTSAYRRTLTLPNGAATITRDQRFIVIVADASNTVHEINETNNNLFAIPLFAINRKGGFTADGGYFNDAGKQEGTIAGGNGARVSRGTVDFAELIAPNNIKTTWERVGGTFALEPLPYGNSVDTNDAFLVHKAVVDPIKTLAALIAATKDTGRFETTRLELTDSFDEESDHTDTSTHYEGRGLDLNADTPSTSKLTGTAEERLAGLALLAGFDFVWYEKDHVHASVRGETATPSLQGLVDALDWGRTSSPPLITDQAVYVALRSTLLQAIALTNAGPPDRYAIPQIRKLLSDFKVLVKDGTTNGYIKQGFASTASSGSLLISNANRLESLYRYIPRPPLPSPALAAPQAVQADLGKPSALNAGDGIVVGWWLLSLPNAVSKHDVVTRQQGGDAAIVNAQQRETAELLESTRSRLEDLHAAVNSSLSFELDNDNAFEDEDFVESLLLPTLENHVLASELSRGFQ